MTIEKPQDSAATTGAASELSAGLGAVLTYRNDGRAGVGGQQVGADGAGTYAVLFMGDPYEAAGAAREYVSRLRGRIRDVVVVTNEPMYLGPAITVVEAPNAQHNRPASAGPG